MHGRHTHDSFRRHFRAYLREHNRTLTVVGALIVFTTFVVKEGVRDRLKDLGDSIDVAESVYAMRSDTAYVIRAIADLQTSLNKMNDAAIQSNGLTAATAEVPSPQLLRETAEVIRARTLGARITADNLERLIERLPILNRSGAAESLENTKTSMVQILADMDGLDVESDRIEKIFASGGDLNQADEDALARLNIEVTATFEDFSKTNAKSMSKFDESAVTILTYAETVRSLDERLYSWLTRVSYLLFTLGWGLGLISRIYGEESSPASDE